MSKTYTRIWSTALQLAYGATKTPSTVLPSIIIPGSNLAVIAIPASAEGDLKHLSVVQTAGSNCVFTVEVLNSIQPYLAVGNEAVATVVADSICLHRIIATQAGSSGVALETFYEYGHAFNNIDGLTPSSPQQFIYLVIIPTGAGSPTTWDASITVRSTIGSQG